MGFKTTISRESLLGMVIVSWMAILLLGGMWAGSMYYDFMLQAEQLRSEHYASQKELVKTRVEEGLAVVEALRRDRLAELWQRLRDRCEQAQALVVALAENNAIVMNADVIRDTVMRSLTAGLSDSALFGERLGNVVFLIDSASWEFVGEEELPLLGQLLSGLSDGERLIALPQSEGGMSCTMLTVVKQISSPSMKIVSAACLESFDAQLKDVVAARLEAIRFSEEGYLFGGTWDGVGTVGPAKGKDMWAVSDVNGIKVVQELVAASKRGGDFVSYVMPAIEGQKNTDKISYARAIPGWEWYVGAGVHVDDIESVIVQNREQLKEEIAYQLGMTFVALVLLSVTTLIVSGRLSQRVRENILLFTEVWKKASSSGAEVDTASLRYNEFRELAQAANRMTLRRREAEESVKENSQRFHMLVESVPGMVFRCAKDEDWTFDFVSDMALPMTGYPSSDFVNNKVRSYSSIIDPMDREWVARTIDDEVKVRKPYFLEYRVMRADGQKRWFQERGQARFDDQGTPVWLDGVIFDITDKKNKEEEYYSHLHFLETMERLDRELRRSSELEDVLFEAMEVIRVAFGADRAWLLFSCDPGELTFTVPIERTVPEFPGAGTSDQDVPVDDYSRAVMSAALDSTEAVAFDTSVDRPISHDLESRFQVKSQLVMALRPRTGKPWLMGIHQCRESKVWHPDEQRLFTEAGRRIADTVGTLLMFRELKNSEEKFRTFFEQTMLAICVVQDNLVVFANQSYCDIFELSIDEMLSLPPGEFLQFVHPDDRDFLMKQAMKKQAGDPDVVHSYSWRALTKTGRIRWVEIHSKTVVLNGRLADLVSLIDITERRQAKENLERLVDERTQDLSRQTAELQEANAGLVRLDELKSSFLKSVSHDLRTPLTSVLGYASLVRKDLNRIDWDSCEKSSRIERVGANIDVIQKEGERLTRLIDDFMWLTAMEAGTAVWHDKMQAVEHCIIRSVRTAEDKLEGKPDLNIVLKVLAELPEMSVDPDRFEQMLDSLLDNAIKFTTRGDIVVTAKPLGHDGISLSVSDTGKGMPEGELDAIFDPFHQVELGDTLVDQVKGSGLGLALCQGIVRHYGGEIRVESYLGKGSTFTVDLPGTVSTLLD